MNEPTTPPPPPPPSEPAAPAGGDTSNRSIMIVLSYLWILALIPLLVEKEDQEVQWHAKHGIVLLVAEIIAWIIIGVLSSGLGIITAGLGCIVSLLSPIVGLGFLIVHIMCIVKGINGERFIIPGISQYADRF